MQILGYVCRLCGEFHHGRDSKPESGVEDGFQGALPQHHCVQQEVLCPPQAKRYSHYLIKTYLTFLSSLSVNSFQEYNISNEMANYMTMVFDPSAPLIHYGLSQFDPHHRSKMKDLAQQLDAILENNNFTFVDLLDAVAVR